MKWNGSIEAESMSPQSAVMCNRFENERSAAELARIIPYPLRVADEAMAWEPLAHQAPQTIGLCVVQQDHEWVMRTATWSFLRPPSPSRGKTANALPTKEPKPTPVFNTRSDRCPPEMLPPAYRYEAPPFPSPFWRGLSFCWLPVTAWLECPQPKTWIRMHLHGTPFLLAGVCGERDGRFRMSMTMTEVPKSLAAIRAGHTRMPLAFSLDAIAEANPQPIHSLIEVADA
jgi:putative SOS response-associated peptidase YedK